MPIPPIIEKSSRVWPSNPTKALVEQAWLLYAPLWMSIAGAIMIFGLAEEAMGDVALMVLGVTLALGLVVSPVALAHARGTTIDHGVLSSMLLANFVLAFGLNYFQTPFFFDVLHMRYGFKVDWRIERNPVFLYFLTMPYFAFYSASGSVAVRFIRSVLRIGTLRTLLLMCTPFAFAFMETLSHVNPATGRIFCYDDHFLALTFGTACYGVSFVLAMPLWLNYGGVPESGKGTRANPVLATVSMALAVLLDAVFLFVIRTSVAPHVTTVVTDSSPFGGCLLSS